MTGAPTVRVDPLYVPFLRETLETARVTRLDDLTEHPDRLRDPVRTRGEVETYARMLAGLDRGKFVADLPARDALSDLIELTDESNEHARGLAEHQAFAHLLDQLPDRSGSGETMAR